MPVVVVFFLVVAVAILFVMAVFLFVSAVVAFLLFVSAVVVVLAGFDEHRLNACQEVDDSNVVWVVAFERLGHVLRPGELRRVEIDEGLGVDDIGNEIRGRGPAVTHATRANGIVEGHLVAGDSLGEGLQRKEHGVAVGVAPGLDSEDIETASEAARRGRARTGFQDVPSCWVHTRRYAIPTEISYYLNSRC